LSCHRRHRSPRRATWRNLFRGRKSQGRARLLHQQPRRRRAVSSENPRAVFCEPEHFARVVAGLHGERCPGGFGESGLCHGRMRQMNMSIFRFISRLVLVLVLMLEMSCGRRITTANVDEVAEGMSKKQAEAIRGS